MEAKPAFTKPPRSEKELIAIMIARGLEIDDQKEAEHYLKYIGYYRLGIYCKFYQKNGDSDHSFKKGTRFRDIVSLYVFDRQLKLLVIDALERIEVAVRTRISNVMCVKHGAHWFSDSKHFSDAKWHSEFLLDIEKQIALEAVCGSEQYAKRPAFVTHYVNTYGSPKHPPSWMIAEALSAGAWSKAFSKLSNPADTQRIFRSFGMDYDRFKSWIHALVTLRNICAHHSVLWNRVFLIKPEYVTIDQKLIRNNHQFYAFAAIIHQFLSAIAPESQWAHRLFELFQKHQTVPILEMGFPTDWHQQAFWKISN